MSGVGPETEGLTPFCLPRLEAACHVEHGGLAWALKFSKQIG